MSDALEAELSAALGSPADHGPEFSAFVASVAAAIQAACGVSVVVEKPADYQAAQVVTWTMVIVETSWRISVLISSKGRLFAVVYYEQCSDRSWRRRPEKAVPKAVASLTD